MGFRALTLAIAWLAVGWAPARARVPQEAPTSITGRATFIVVEEPGKGEQRLLSVLTPTGRPVLVHATPEQTAAVRSGMQVSVAGCWRRPAGTAAAAAAAAVAVSAASFQATAITASGGSSSKPQLATVPAAPAVSVAAAAATAAVTISSNSPLATSLSTLIIPMANKAADGTACAGTQLPLYTPAQVEEAMFEELNPSGITLGSTFRKCSGGLVTLTTANSTVVDTVTLNCSGTTSWGTPWGTTACGWDDYNGWAEAADAALTDRGVDLSKYKFRIYLMPPNACTWVGTGFEGCVDAEGPCRVWIRGNRWTTPQSMVHELGHNLYLGHAGATDAASNYNPYADLTSTMGYCCWDRCPNTPQAWQLGWLALQQLDGTTLTAGMTVTATIYAQHLAVGVASRVGGLRIQPTWLKSAVPVVVGYRLAAGGDATLDPELLNRLHVYRANMTGSKDVWDTDWRTPNGLVKGGVWADAASGLVVRVTATTTPTATLTVCRKAGVETLASCKAGLDNDCNGLIGSRDAVCAKLLAPTATQRRIITLIRRPAATQRTTTILIRRLAA